MQVFTRLGLHLSVLVAVLSPVHTYSAFMDGKLSSQADFNVSPEGFVGIFGNIGAAVVDTTATAARFSQNLVSLDLMNAIDDVGGVFSKGSADEILVQFSGHIPAILESASSWQTKPSTSATLKSYFTDKKLSLDEAKALFSHVMSQSHKTPEEKKAVFQALQQAMLTIKSGAPGLSTAALGQSFAASMKKAIDAAHKPMPVFGNPLAERRRLAISKAFFHSLIQQHGTHLVRGQFEVFRKSLLKNGLTISPLTDAQATSLLNAVAEDFNLESCFNQAKDQKEILDCLKNLSSQQTRILGVVLDLSRGWLAGGEMKISFRNGSLPKAIDIGKILQESLKSQSAAVSDLRRRGEITSVNQILNDFSRRIGQVLGDDFVSRLASGSSPHLQSGLQTLIHNFTTQAKLVPDDNDNLMAYFKDTFRAADFEKPHTPLDKKIRPALQKSLQMTSSKAAVLGMVLERSGFTSDAIKSILTTYNSLQKNSRLATQPPSLKEFLKAFDRDYVHITKIPSDISAIKYLKSLGAPESTVFNSLMAKFQASGSALLGVIHDCRGIQGTPACRLESESKIADVVDMVEKAYSALKNSPQILSQCNGTKDKLLNEVFSNIPLLKTNLIKSPSEILTLLKNDSIQNELHCLAAGAALAKGLSAHQALWIFESLQREKANLPNSGVVDLLVGYLRNSTKDPLVERKLSNALSQHAKSIAFDMARQAAQQRLSGWGADELSKVENFLGRVIDNIPLQKIMEESPGTLSEKISDLINKPLEANAWLDVALKDSIRKELESAQTQSDFFNVMLEVADKDPNNSLNKMAPGITTILRDAHRKRAAGLPIPEGVRSFLDSYDSTVAGALQYVPTQQSLMDFVKNFGQNRSQVASRVLRDNAGGLRDLFMSFLSCDYDSTKTLCQSCRGESGRWIYRDPKTKKATILADKNFGLVLQLLKSGMNSIADSEVATVCRKEIPRVMEALVKELSIGGRAQGSADSGLVFDILKQPTFSKAQHCVLAGSLDKMFLSQFRSKSFQPELMARLGLAALGTNSNLSLFKVDGGFVFKVLSRMGDHAKAKEFSHELWDSLKELSVESNESTRQRFKDSVGDFSRFAIAASIMDPLVAAQLLGTKDISLLETDFNTWDALGRKTVACVKNHYSQAISPVAYFVAEQYSGLWSYTQVPWVKHGTRSTGAPQVENGAETNPDTELCADSVESKSKESNQNKKDRPWLDYAYVGNYDRIHTQMQQFHGRSTPFLKDLNSVEQIKSRASDIQKIFVASLERLKNKDTTGAASAMGDVQRVAQNIPEGLRLGRHLKESLDFPIQEISMAFDSYKKSPTPQSKQNLERLLKNHCPKNILESSWDNLGPADESTFGSPGLTQQH